MTEKTSEMIITAVRDASITAAISLGAAKLHKPAVMLLVPLCISSFKFNSDPLVSIKGPSNDSIIFEKEIN